MPKLFFIISMFLLSGGIRSQHNDFQVGTSNIVSGAVMGGIGSLINKEKGEKTHKVILKGMAQGALGGYMVFESKRMLRSFSKSGNYASIWPSRIVNFAGNSIVMNAASNRNFWEKWHINIGFNHFELDFKEEKKFKYRIMPIALLGNIYGFANGKIDVSKSLITGNFIFESKKRYRDFGAFTFLNTIIYSELEPESYINQIVAHELIHVYQYEGLIVANSYLNDPISRLSKVNNFQEWYNSVFYTDYQSMSALGIIGLESLLSIPYEDRLFEKEAYYFDGPGN